MSLFAGISFAETAKVPENNTTEVSAKAESYFNLAHDSFLKKDMKMASEETKKAMKVLQDEFSHATAEGKKLLQKSVTELEKFAGDLEKGTVSSEKKLTDTFANARNAIAKHHLKTDESAPKKAAYKA